MNPLLSRFSWVLALRGVLAILFGVLVFFWPVLFWFVAVASFAAYALLDGIFTVVAASHAPRRDAWWWALLFRGLLGIGCAILAVIFPYAAGYALLFIIAGWSIATGVFEIAVAIELRKQIKGEWLLALSGVLSILFGVAIAVAPVAGAIAIAWFIGAYSIAFGVMLLALAVRLRGSRSLLVTTGSGKFGPAV
jgi:uncharacterized membrane protein HdeD (DUF308 family)